MKIKANNDADARLIAKRMVYLAWKASSVHGFGAFQDQGDKSEEAVWEGAVGQRDYPMKRPDVPGEVHCDYVFGRMMKWACYWEDGTITVPDIDFRSDYQSFKHKYPDNMTLAAEAIKSLGSDAVIEV